MATLPVQAPGDAPTNRPYSKNGCKTCRIRKVKCDEGWPSCRRCISARRVCDGYGIWGGGGGRRGSTHVHQRQQLMVPNSHSVVRLQERPGALSTIRDSSETEYLDWFLSSTKQRIAGPFILDFWRLLVVQASQVEPSILNAILSLAAVRRRDYCNGYGSWSSADVPDDQERFMLRHYVQATSQLKALLLTDNKPAVRVALISCLLFVSLEFLRGHFGTGQAHLQAGLRLLGNFAQQATPESVPQALPYTQDHAWKAIREAYNRLELHVGLFHSTHAHSAYHSGRAAPIPYQGSFTDGRQAWDHLEHLLHKIMKLMADHSRLSNKSQAGAKFKLYARQQDLHSEVEAWGETLFASKHNMPMADYKMNAGEVFVMRYLLSWHAMATFMTATCLGWSNSSTFEPFDDAFASIVQHCADMHAMRVAQRDVVVHPGHLIQMSHTSVDFGWLPPLYLTALRCSIRSIRLRAIELIESSSHREGIWDSKICARVARAALDMPHTSQIKVELSDDSKEGVRVLHRPCSEAAWEVTYVFI